MNVKQLVYYFFGKSIKLFTLLIAVSLFAFSLISFSPIDPVQSYVGADMTRVSPEQREQIAEYWGLHDSKVEQFSKWARSILKGDLGTSLLYRSPVSEVISERFFSSLALMLIAWLFSGTLGFFLGVLAGMKEGTWIDRLIKGYCYSLTATPAFWLGLLLLMVFSVWLGWFPIGLGTPAGALTAEVSILERLRHLFLPALMLSVVGIATITLHTRQKLIEILNSDFIRFAMAKGQNGFTLLWRHGLRHILLPAISVHFASFGELFGGAVLAEQVFSYPGLGQAVVQAGLGSDVPLLLGIVLFSTMFVFAGNMLADLLYKIVDPRLKGRARQ